MHAKCRLFPLILIILIAHSPISWAQNGQKPQQGPQADPSSLPEKETLRGRQRWYKKGFLNDLFSPAHWIEGSGLKVTLTPAFAFRTTYDSNLFYREEEDFEHRLSPVLDLTLDSGRTETWVRGKWDIYRYTQYDKWNTTEQFYNLETRRWFTEKLQLSLLGEASQYTTVRNPTGDIGEEEFVDEVSDVTKYGISPEGKYFINEKNMLDIGYYAEKKDYENEELFDYLYHVFLSSWSKRWSETSAVYGELALSYLDSEQSLTTATSTGTTVKSWLGTELRPTETLKFSLRGGLRYTTTNYEFAQETTEETGWDGLVLVNFLWLMTNKSRLIGIYERDQYPGPHGDYRNRDKVQLRWGHNFTKRFNLSLTGQWARVQGNTDVLKNDKQQLLKIQPEVVYSFSENSRLTGGYKYNIKENEQRDRSQDRHRVYFSIRLAWPKVF